jgi:hypothetical protein
VPRGTSVNFLGADLPFPVEPVVGDLVTADLLGGLTGPNTLRFRDDARRFESWERSVASAASRAATTRQRCATGTSNQDLVTVLKRCLRHAVRGASPRLTPAVVATSAATSKSSNPSISSTRPYDLEAPARSGRIYSPPDKVEGLVQANWVEVRVLFGASEGPA